MKTGLTLVSDFCSVLTGCFVFILQQTVGSLPSYAGLVNEATKLNKESQVLKTKTSDADANLKRELDKARMQEADAELVNCSDRDNESVVRIMNCWTKW